MLKAKDSSTPRQPDHLRHRARAHARDDGTGECDVSRPLLFTVIKKGAVYSLVAVSMNLLNGFTGLFSLGQAGFMPLGAYAYAIFMIPDAARDGVYYLFEGSSIHFSFQEMFQHLFGATGFGGGVSLVLGVLVAIIFAGLIAAFFAYLIGLPVLRLKSDYLAIATLGFAEILRAIFQWQTLGKVTNGANILKGYPTFADFAITNASGKVTIPPECGRADFACRYLHFPYCPRSSIRPTAAPFKAIRDDEIAAERHGREPRQAQEPVVCHQLVFRGRVGRALCHVCHDRAGQGVHLGHDL
ncbi:MAG: branched-chain amino acid ABC transporter permease [Oscillospiraceae bacterium]